ncbi:SRPBCC family protein [Deinococcus maricopensis]|uniref:Polyketide cyclase/dehydrase n=1 Tax=Deinococcus maricopensis (strain DSM 21211 / LMG 22137 / NRRL B-23946 / LB-34) TaxID=709986 RepID=E8UAC6_DEIML|nr:SRPBCC family protein [Deinococcus maricopensis]ADV68015.1 Polyketide cyclase/dehydrase [Deinococcus maricopensis DSM 21211]
MSELITFKDTVVIRARPDVLFRQALDPKRRWKWDPNVRNMSYTGEERIVQNAALHVKLPNKMLGLSFPAKYLQVQAPTRGGYESTRPFGPVEKFSQAWGFKPIPGGTEVTLTTNARVRFKWAAKPVERLLRNASAQTLIELQRSVDAQGAQLLEDTAKRYQEQQKEAQKAARAAKGGRRKR